MKKTFGWRIKSNLGSDSAKRALQNERNLEKQKRMEEALEKRKREAEEKRGALGRQLDSERRKHHAENSKQVILQSDLS